jgi:hypothetical protein
MFDINWRLLPKTQQPKPDPKPKKQRKKASFEIQKNKKEKVRGKNTNGFIGYWSLRFVLPCLCLRRVRGRDPSAPHGAPLKGGPKAPPAL